MASIINRNLFRLLRSGAFQEDETLEPMSAFKWKRLLQIAEVQEITPYIARGLAHHQGKPYYPSSPSLKEDLDRISTLRIPEVEELVAAITESTPHLSNFILKRLQKRILQKDISSEESSVETRQLLLLLIHNINQTLTRGITLNGYTTLGRFLRTKGDRVDFVKTEHWLHQLGIRKFCNLQGSILTDVFHFEEDELPFMLRHEQSAARLTQRSMSHTAYDTAENWHFRMRTNGMVENNSRVLRRNLRRSVRYLRYHPFETTSNFIANFARSLSEIEE